MSTQPIHLMPTKVWSDIPTPSRRQLLWEKEGKKCHWCDCPTRMVADNSWDKATIDHVIPRYKGGTNEDNNLVSACNRCNNRRNHEDARGLPEGHLLGKFKEGGEVASSNSHNKRKPLDRVALSGDEKKAITTRQTSGISLNAERDRLLQELIKVRDEKKVLDAALEARGLFIKHLQSENARLLAEKEEISIRILIRKAIGKWLLTLSKKCL